MWCWLVNIFLTASRGSALRHAIFGCSLVVWEYTWKLEQFSWPNTLQRLFSLYLIHALTYGTKLQFQLCFVSQMFLQNGRQTRIIFLSTNIRFHNKYGLHFMNQRTFCCGCIYILLEMPVWYISYTTICFGYAFVIHAHAALVSISVKFHMVISCNLRYLMAFVHIFSHFNIRIIV